MVDSALSSSLIRLTKHPNRVAQDHLSGGAPHTVDCAGMRHLGACCGAGDERRQVKAEARACCPEIPDEVFWGG